MRYYVLPSFFFIIGDELVLHIDNCKLTNGLWYNCACDHERYVAFVLHGNTWYNWNRMI